MRRWRLATVMVAVVLLAAACGGDDAGDTEASGDTTATTTDAASGDTGTTEATGTSDGAITIADFAFEPAELVVAVGAEVTVTNDDSAAHTWTSSDEVWDSDELEQGASFSHTFEEAGSFTYICKIHPSMRGTVTVS